MAKVLVFVSTKSLADNLFSVLQEKWPEHVGVIHSNKDQNYRFKAVTTFKEGTIRILVATDIIARGIDVEDVSHVVNFDIPDDPLLYIHRIGRTGRADKLGEAISLVSNIDADHWQRVVDHLGASPDAKEVPEAVEISDQLTDDEMPKVQMKNVLAQVPKIQEGSAYHEKKASNKKVNRKISHKEKMMTKYGKPKTRGAKRK
jgi:ATP-dependent RNA helicase RhlE